jgi:hypothetical protein
MYTCDVYFLHHFFYTLKIIQSIYLYSASNVLNGYIFKGLASQVRRLPEMTDYGINWKNIGLN